MAYKYSDYTVVINFMQCPKHDFGAETLPITSKSCIYYRYAPV